MSSEPTSSPANTPANTHPDDLEAILSRLAAKKEQWAQASLAARVELLRKILDGALLVSERWVEASARAKGLDPSDPRAGEEWLSGPMPFVQNVRMMIDALGAGGALKPARVRTRPDGRHVARVFPLDMLHRL